ncbi:D-glycero-beta-D-manno-heptose 1-phosphate adenylyltransferase [Mastigocladopsis repens]|uniref:D-glycero-beta-D-manno-heptose 1-phosphate adenylyltransferase n=1 Tax=Mastigocladopsis repens TaxID=221287 RepID=UPI0002E1AE86|nr:D-glycero-beta-D-manno-heptose 1-phosphate adenylyltransferase [Mastigocladopsis repens]
MKPDLEMSEEWSAFLAKGIAHPKVIVIGEAMLDCYLQGETLGSLSPVPIVKVNHRKQIPGGAADTAFYLKSLGTQVIFFSVIGEDWEGNLLRQTLEESGITTSYLLADTTRQTLTKQKVMVGSQLLMTMNSGSTDAIDPYTEKTLINQLKDCFAQSHAVIVCNYGYGIVTQGVMQTLAQLQHSFPHVLIFDEKGTREAGEVMTSSSPHSSLPTSNKHIPDLDQLLALVTSYRMTGRKIVFTNGCFDILHAGHVSYLQRAKALGDILIIGVNSDNSIRRLKGPTRPINPLEDRIQVLAALGCVDHLIAFEEDSPSHLIRKLRPDIYVKGGDYTKETLPETPVVEEYGGEIAFLPFVENRSTTKIIERILQGENK